ncbi:unnamed protein product [Citrullus colocynthis]|uniref:Uncharacterized protein n=1 Tax=Citrullus colocynthis TaxID=252529 RepID=A0ABP0Y651_9ROSI
MQARWPLLQRETDTLNSISRIWPVPSTGPGTDLLIWNLSKKGLFFVKSMKEYLHSNSSTISATRTGFLWSSTKTMEPGSISSPTVISPLPYGTILERVQIQCIFNSFNPLSIISST